MGVLRHTLGRARGGALLILLSGLYLFGPDTVGAGSRWGPMAVIVGGDGAVGVGGPSGTVSIVGKCVELQDDSGGLWTVVWNASAVEWSRGQQAIAYTDPKGRRLLIRHGDQLEIAGGFGPNEQPELPPWAVGDVADRVAEAARRPPPEWVAAPSADCAPRRYTADSAEALP